MTTLPLLVIFLVGAMFMLAFGETSSPLAMGNPGSNPVHLEDTPGGIAPMFTPEVQYWELNILTWAGEWGLDPNLVATVMQIESCGDPAARSHAGAMGLFQVMPFHFNASDSPYNPNTNAQRGMAYLRQALDTHGSIRLAFAGYNGGIGTAGRVESLWPSETIRYTAYGTTIYADANQDKADSAYLEEWLSRGGASLCAQANQRLGIDP